jgi:hypothetical protein
VGIILSVLERSEFVSNLCRKKNGKSQRLLGRHGGKASWWALHARRRRSERRCEGQLRGKDCGDLRECTHKRTVSSAEDVKEGKVVGVLMAQTRDHEEAGN